MVLVQHLASSEEYRELHPVAFFEEFTCVIYLYIQVVLFGFRPESDFLQCRGVLLVFFMCLTCLSFLLIQPLAVIYYPANGRLTRWSDFYKV